MMKAVCFAKLGRQCSRLRLCGTHALSQHTTMFVRSLMSTQRNADPVEFLDSEFGNHRQFALPERDFGAVAGAQSVQDLGAVPRPKIGESVSRQDKVGFLLSTLHDLDDSREAIYSALDAWVAWERNFPIGLLKMVLVALEKEKQYHKIIQVIKWMLSKGQGTTMGTYKQLIHALDMDHRAKEAHEFWMRKIGFEFHSVPWELCNLMISVYYRNNMLQDLTKLFEGLETFDRKPPEKSIIQKVADAYEMLGQVEGKERVLTKYQELFTEKPEKKRGSPFRKRRPADKRTSPENDNPSASQTAPENDVFKSC